jgi:hypothetical protein
MKGVRHQLLIQIQRGSGRLLQNRVQTVFGANFLSQ